MENVTWRQGKAENKGYGDCGTDDGGGMTKSIGARDLPKTDFNCVRQKLQIHRTRLHWSVRARRTWFLGDSVIRRTFGGITRTQCVSFGIFFSCTPFVCSNPLNRRKIRLYRVKTIMVAHGMLHMYVYTKTRFAMEIRGRGKYNFFLFDKKKKKYWIRRP